MNGESKVHFIKEDFPISIVYISMKKIYIRLTFYMQSYSWLASSGMFIRLTLDVNERVSIEDW